MATKRRVLYFIISLIVTNFVDSARILATIFTPAYSHQTFFRPLWLELAKRGHEITLLTTDPMNDSELKNIKQIDLSKSYEIMEENRASKILSGGKSNESYLQRYSAYVRAIRKTADWQLGHPEVKNLIQNKTEWFDLIMVETLVPSHLGFVDRFNVPFIGITSLDAPTRVHRSVGNFMHPILFRDWMLPFGKKITFKQRVICVIFSWSFWAYEYLIAYPSTTRIARKHFGDNIRPVNEIEKDMSLLFINVNPLFHTIRPMGPNTILIGGGTRLNKIQALSEDLQYFMGNASQGVIYFSLGTNIKSYLVEDEFKSTILETFSELPYKIIWKFEKDTLKNIPKNVKILKWTPQQEIFQHPNLKLFITQCGLQSMEEAIHNHIPMVGIPFFGDQPSNSKILEENGLGLVVDRKNLTKTIFKETILEVINNPIYRKKIRELSDLMKDVEINGLEKAVWWTEYTIRTNGAKHLRSPQVDLPAYQFYLLDVIGFLLITIVIFSFVIIKILKLLIKMCKKLKGKNKTE